MTAGNSTPLTDGAAALLLASEDWARKKNLPVLGLFESSHMEYEYDRPLDVGGEPSLDVDIEVRLDRA